MQKKKFTLVNEIHHPRRTLTNRILTIRLPTIMAKIWGKEDNWLIILLTLSFTVTTTSTLMASNHPSLAIWDLRWIMPNCGKRWRSGIERSMKRTAILVKSSAVSENVKGGKEGGCVDYIRQVFVTLVNYSWPTGQPHIALDTNCRVAAIKLPTQSRVEMCGFCECR